MLYKVYNSKILITIHEIGGHFLYKHLGFAELYVIYEGWNFNSRNYLFTTDTK